MVSHIMNIVIKTYLKDSANMSEVADSSIQMAITAWAGPKPGGGGGLTILTIDSASNMPHSLEEWIRIVKKHYGNIHSFVLSLNDGEIQAIYQRQIVEIERVLTDTGVFILNIGNPWFGLSQDVFMSESSLLFPYIIAEDIIDKTSLRLRHEYLSIVDINGNYKIERWFVFSKKEKWKENKLKLPTILKGRGEIVGNTTTYPKNIINMLIRKYTSKGDWLLDPYAGIGTLASVAEPLGRNTILYEIQPEIYSNMVKNLKSFSCMNSSFLS